MANQFMSVANLGYTVIASAGVLNITANDVVSATLVVNSPAVTYHIANTIHIDGYAHGESSYTIDTDWVGGSAPDAGNGSGHDIYSFTIIKTADKTFTILANALAAA